MRSKMIMGITLLISLACTTENNMRENPTPHQGSQDAAGSGHHADSAREGIMDVRLDDGDNSMDFLKVSDKPLSTVSIDVDSASFTRSNAYLEQGLRPDPDQVRIEEFINFLRYDYPTPQEGQIISMNFEDLSSPWTPGHRLMKIGLQGTEISSGESAELGRNFVFLVDTSGSMEDPKKLPLLKNSLRTLLSNLRASDRISLVTYAGSSKVLIEGGSTDNSDSLLSAIDSLGSGGGTNGAEGINTAYALASKYFSPGGVNRVIMATDGDLNVGATSSEALVALAKSHSEQSIYLTILGFGMYGNDELLESFSNDADGNYYFIGSESEADRILGSEINSTLVTIAKDVKVQIEFNPRLVASYRLIGYQNRRLEDDEFNDDSKDAGDMGSGQQVTYLYEYQLNDNSEEFSSNFLIEEGVDVDPLIYQEEGVLTEAAARDELLTLKVRYKASQGGISQLQQTSITPTELEFADGTSRTKLAVAAASIASHLAEIEALSKGLDEIGALLDSPVEGTIGRTSELRDMLMRIQSLQDN